MKGALIYVMAAGAAVGGVFLAILYGFELHRVAIEGGPLLPLRDPPFYYASRASYIAFNLTFLVLYLVVFLMGTSALLSRKSRPAIAGVVALLVVYVSAMVLAAV